MAKTKEPQTIKIPPIEFKVARITIIGESPLMVNKFSEKAKNELDEKHQQKAKGARKARNPMQEFEDAAYKIDKKTYGIPASGVKHCAVSACRFIEGVNMTTARGAFQIVGDIGGLLPISSKSGPQLDERIVRVGNFGNKKPMTRYRPRFDDWKITFNIKYNANVMSAEQIVNLYENAGFAVGLCELRPEKNGNLGQFRVDRG